MTDTEELKYLKKWLAGLHELNPNFRQPMNSISIRLTGKFLAIDAKGTVEIAEVEGWGKDTVASKPDTLA